MTNELWTSSHENKWVWKRDGVVDIDRIRLNALDWRRDIVISSIKRVNNLHGTFEYDLKSAFRNWDFTWLKKISSDFKLIVNWLESDYKLYWKDLWEMNVLKAKVESLKPSELSEVYKNVKSRSLQILSNITTQPRKFWSPEDWKKEIIYNANQRISFFPESFENLLLEALGHWNFKPLHDGSLELERMISWLEEDYKQYYEASFKQYREEHKKKKH